MQNPKCIDGESINSAIYFSFRNASCHSWKFTSWRNATVEAVGEFCPTSLSTEDYVLPSFASRGSPDVTRGIAFGLQLAVLMASHDFDATMSTAALDSIPTGQHMSFSPGRSSTEPRPSSQGHACSDTRRGRPFRRSYPFHHHSSELPLEAR